MSQAQSQSKPPPLREVLFQAEPEEKAKDKDQFYDELYAAEHRRFASARGGAATGDAPTPTEVRGYSAPTNLRRSRSPRQEPAPVPVPIEGRWAAIGAPVTTC